MNPVIDRLKLIFVGVFLVLNAAMLVWQFGWVVPRENCEKQHKWWDGAARTCAQPVLISDITGRVIDNPQAKQAALRALGRPVPPSVAQAAAAQAAQQAAQTAAPAKK